VLAAAAGEHAGRDGQSLTIGTARPLTVHSGDGSLLRVPDTPGNRAAFGSVGTADGSAAWPCVRLFPLNNCLTRSLLAMPWGPAGTDKTASGQALLDTAMRDFPHVFAKGQVWLLDRLWHGTPRLRALAQLTHFAVRLKSDIPLKRISQIYPGHTYLAEISGDGVTMTVRVIEYFADIEGQQVEEMFCLVTDLLDWREYPGPELAGLHKWRWDGSETALREAKAPLHGAGPGTGAMLRSGSPEPIAQEIAAWTVSTAMTAGTSDARPADTRQAATGHPGRPVEPARHGAARRPQPCPRTRNYRTSPKREPPIKAQTRKARGIEAGPAACHLWTRGAPVSRAESRVRRDGDCLPGIVRAHSHIAARDTGRAIALQI
jgi:hypothetical protein